MIKKCTKSGVYHHGLVIAGNWLAIYKLFFKFFPREQIEKVYQKWRLSP